MKLNQNDTMPNLITRICYFIPRNLQQAVEWFFWL